MSVEFAITGIQEAQQRNLRRIAALKPKGALGRMVQEITVGAHRYAVIITHVDTGSLRASHRMKVSALQGQVFIDRNAVNPRSRVKPAEYGVYEHERGGGHAFYERTAKEAGPRLLRQSVQVLRKELQVA